MLMDKGPLLQQPIAVNNTVRVRTGCPITVAGHRPVLLRVCQAQARARDRGTADVCLCGPESWVKSKAYRRGKAKDAAKWAAFAQLVGGLVSGWNGMLEVPSWVQHGCMLRLLWSGRPSRDARRPIGVLYSHLCIR